ncbi:MAG TPA: DUF269 domain-containing protein [Xenococcaceae cyanobacterium]|jgi:probable nitrogen fixation protein
MSQVLIPEKPPQLNKFQHPFIAELIKQIRQADTYSKYRQWSDELLVKQLIISSDQEAVSSKNLNFDPLNQLLTHAFYQTIGINIARKTGHTTDTFVHLRNKEFSSAVITCGGVLVLYSLIWGYRSFGFGSLPELIEVAETKICDAVTKANCYLEFT